MNDPNTQTTHTKAAKPAKKQKPVDKDAQAIMSKFKRMKPLLSREDVFKGEETMDAFGISRRVAFMIGTKSGKELIAMVSVSEDASAEVLAEMLIQVQQAKSKIDAMQALASACEMRFITALCYREDMGEIYTRAGVGKSEMRK